MTTKQQRRQGLRLFIKRVAAEALENVSLSNAAAARLLARGDELRPLFAEAMYQVCRDTTPLAASGDDYAYPKGYKPKSIAKQLAILRKHFPGLSGTVDKSIAKQPLPHGAEAWFTIPRWDALAPTYDEAVAQVMAAIASTRKTGDSLRKFIEAGSLQQTRQKPRMMGNICNQQEGRDIVVVPAQFGFRHKGVAPAHLRRVFAADEMFDRNPVNEFGLGLYEVGIMLLTHPERVVEWNQLHVACPGDTVNWSWRGKGDELVPMVIFTSGDLLGLVATQGECGRPRVVSASAFVYVRADPFVNGYR